MILELTKQNILNLTNESKRKAIPVSYTHLSVHNDKTPFLSHEGVIK